MRWREDWGGLNTKTNEWQRETKGWGADYQGPKESYCMPCKRNLRFISDPLSLERTPNLLIMELHRASLSHTHSFSSCLFSLSFHFCVFRWLPANLFPPAAVSISPAVRAPPASESNATLCSSFLRRITHNGGLKPPSRSAYLLLIGCERRGPGAESGRSRHSGQIAGRGSSRRDLNVTLICCRSRRRDP